jgi:hypothetical protein
MSALGRIMRAYAKKHPLTPDQAVIVRRELSLIIDDLLTRPRRAPMMLPESAEDAGRRVAHRCASGIAEAVGRHVRVATGQI